MMMTRTVSVALFLAMLALHQSLAEDAPSASPAPAPITGSDDSPPPAIPSDASSPPLVDLGSPAPLPADASVYSPAEDSRVEKDVSEEGGGGRGKKVGIAFGAVASACVVGIGAMVYKKRRDNIRRSQYGQDARGSLL